MGQTVAIFYQNPRAPKKYLKIMTHGREWQMAKICYKGDKGNVCGLINASYHLSKISLTIKADYIYFRK